MVLFVLRLLKMAVPTRCGIADITAQTGGFLRHLTRRVTWTKYDNSTPSASDTIGTNGRIPLGNANTADVSHAYMPEVIKDGSVYKMWYNMHNGVNIRIGYTTSPDGLTWTKQNNTTELASNSTGTDGRLPLGISGSGDDSNIYVPSVIKINNTYRMWYGGTNGTNYRIYSATMNSLFINEFFDDVIKQEGSYSLKLSPGITATDSATVGLWHLDETGGTGAYLKDVSGNANHGTPTGTTVVDGISNKARGFNGSSDYILLSDSSSLNPGTGNFTITAWVKPSIVDSTSRRIYEDYGSTTANLALLRIDTTNLFQALYRDGSSNYAAANSTTIAQVGKWYYLAAVKNGTTVSIYVNGILESSVINSSLGTITTSDGNAPQIGRYYTASPILWRHY